MKHKTMIITAIRLQDQSSVFYNKDRVDFAISGINFPEVLLQVNQH